MKAVAAVVFGMAALLVASSPSRAQGIAPFDLIWDAIDVNGLPVDPSWGYQLIRGPADPPLPDTGRLCDNISRSIHRKYTLPEPAHLEGT
ncbi:MAG: hypothetical protein QOK29_727, partial [Rhodospirillaceae bacterium]|nr:hypothetical protein [Rhodospirillaceae bacterium]